MRAKQQAASPVGNSGRCQDTVKQAADKRDVLRMVGSLSLLRELAERMRYPRLTGTMALKACSATGF